MQQNGSHYKLHVVGSLGPTHCCFCQVLMLQSRALPERRLTLARLVLKPKFLQVPCKPHLWEIVPLRSCLHHNPLWPDASHNSFSDYLPLKSTVYMSITLGFIIYSSFLSVKCLTMGTYSSCPSPTYVVCLNNNGLNQTRVEEGWKSAHNLKQWGHIWCAVIMCFFWLRSCTMGCVFVF